MALIKQKEKKETPDQWMFTYSDTMTLLFCFFVLITSMMTFSKDKVEKVRSALRKSLQIDPLKKTKLRIFIPAASIKSSEDLKGKVLVAIDRDKVDQLSLKDDVKKDIKEKLDDKTDKKEYMETTDEKLPFRELADKLQEYIIKHHIDTIVKIYYDEEELDLIFTDLFQSASVAVRKKYKNHISYILKTFSEELDNWKKKRTSFEIELESHADSLAITNPLLRLKFKTNWELSVSRSITMMKNFMKAGFPEKRISITGYGSTKPIYRERDDNGKIIRENLAKNRRLLVRAIDSGVFLKEKPFEKGLKDMKKKEEQKKKKNGFMIIDPHKVETEIQEM